MKFEPLASVVRHSCGSGSGGSPHLLKSLKRRPGEHGDRLSGAHLIWAHDSGDQTEAYLFRNADGSTEIYAHFETNSS